MLRNSFMKRYKSPNQHDNDSNNHYISKEEEEQLISKNRPINDKQIKAIPHKLLYTFVEDLLTDCKLTSVIFSSNTKNEIAYYKSSNKASRRSSANTSKASTKSKKDCTTTSRNEFRNQFELIKEHINSYKSTKQDKIINLNQKNGLFYKKLLRQKQYDMQEGANVSITTMRKKSLNRTIQRCKSYYATRETFDLPDVELNLKNVYSRLYHNSIFVDHDKRDKATAGSTDHNKDKDANKDAQTVKSTKTIKKLILKNVVDVAKGNKFSFKANENRFTRCLLKHSGGPMSNEHRQIIKSIAETDDLEDQCYVSIRQLRDKNNNTYLHDAVLDNSPKFVKYYLAKSLSPNAQNIFGDTPLHYAMRLNNLDVIKQLLNAKGDIYTLNANKETPYDLASVSVKRLLKDEGRVNVRYLPRK